MCASRCYVGSEVGNLKRVLLHRPDLSLKRLTPSNSQEFLFDDVLRIEQAGKEHDYFSKLLINEGVEVLFLKNLLTDILQEEVSREWLLSQHCSPYYLGNVLADTVKDFLRNQSASSIANFLLGGITKAELTDNATSLVEALKHTTDFILPPLPNHLFTRDSSCWIHQGVSINPMAKNVRKRETINLRAIYQFHPIFTETDFHYWFGNESIDYQSATLEGGDVLVIGNGLILIGLGERSTPEAVELLSESLFRQSNVNTVIAVELPKERSTMHLDTVMTMLNHECFTIYPPVMDHVKCWEIKPGKHHFHIQALKKNLFDYIADYLGTNKIQLIPTGGDEFQMEREQWNDANNLLAIRPGVVIGYERNTYTIEKMIAKGITVHTIPGTELGRGRGGTRCMSCPIERDDL